MGITIPASLPALAIVEPFFVPDTHITGIAAFSRIAGNLRISLYAERPEIGIMPKEGVIVCHLVMSMRTFMSAYEQAGRDVYLPTKNGQH